MGRFGRLCAHVFAAPAGSLFPADVLARIGTHIARCETRHRGEIVFAVESDMPLGEVWRGVGAHDRALGAFAHLGVWNTHANNGVLLYLLLAERRLEIIADRGLDGLVSAEQWRGVCQLMEERLAANEPEDAVQAGVDAISALLELHFPQVPGTADEDELPDLPRILR